MGEPIIIDYDARQAANAACAAEDEVSDLSGSIVLVLAHQTAADPVAITFDDPSREPFICDSGVEFPVIRPLQRFEGEPLVARAVKSALKAGALAVYVLAPSVAAGGFAAMNDVTTTAIAAGAMGVTVYDPHRAEEARKASRSFELFGMSRYILDCAAECLARITAAQSVLIMDCTQARIAPRHLQQISHRLAANPHASIVASWIAWLRRPPLIIRRSWLENLANLQNGPHGIRHLRTCDVVFGEEQLAANQTWPRAFTEFCERRTLSALEAVRMVKRLAADPSAKVPGKSGNLSNLSAADAMLISLARQTIAGLRGTVSANLEARVAAADAWGARNKLDFPLFADKRHRNSLVYLDSAATAQRVNLAQEAQLQFDLHENANVYRGAYDLSAQATATLNDARKVLEDFIGANRRETIFTQNASTACTLVAQAWGEANVRTGDLVAVCLADHHSAMLPWTMLAERQGARVAFIPLDDAGHLDRAAFASVLAQKPKIVCLPHISNTLGIVNPVKELAEQAHAAGARVFVDGAQSLPHVPVNVYDLGCDFFAFSGHKTYGPLGIGGVWVHPSAFAEMRPRSAGGGTVSHAAVDSYYLRLASIGYELGTPPISQAVGLAAALSYLNTLGMAAVEEHSRALSEYLLAGLAQIDGITVLGRHESPEELSGLVSLCVAGMQPAEIATVLGRVGIAVRSGGHCALPLAASLGIIGSARISLGVYNTREDIEAALVALRLCRMLFR